MGTVVSSKPTPRGDSHGNPGVGYFAGGQILFPQK